MVEIMEKRCSHSSGKDICVTLTIIIFFLGSITSVTAQGNRHLVMIVDTSGSMDENDPEHYAVQSAKILNDILAVDDQISLIKFPQSHHCKRGGTTLTINRKKNDFSRAIESHIGNRSGSQTTFAEPLRNAVTTINGNSKDRNLLLVITDEGTDHFKCPGDEEKLLKSLADNTFRASINIGNGNINAGNDFDFHEYVDDSPSLIRAIAEVYQKFIGGTGSQNGTIRNQKFSLNIDPYVKEAFIVVAADGLVGPIQINNSNTLRGSVDENYKTGVTEGEDQIKRQYRIARLTHPEQGSWQVQIPELITSAGWMLIQEYSVGIRFISPTIVTVNEPLQLEAELFDEITQKSLPISPDTSLSIEFEGKLIKFSKLNDKFIAQITFANEGQHILKARITAKHIDKTSLVQVKVIQPVWEILPKIGSTLIVDQSTDIKVLLKRRQGVSKIPKTVTMITPEGSIALEHDMQSNTSPVYIGSWQPSIVGQHEIQFSIDSQFLTEPITQKVNVVGYVNFSDVQAIDFGTLIRKQESERWLDLNAEIRGTVELELKTQLNKSNVVLFRQVGKEWLEVRPTQTLLLSEQDLVRWPLKLVTYSCPEETSHNDMIQITASHTNHLGHVSSIDIPVTVMVIPDHWFVCWWPKILLLTLLSMILKALHCYATTAKFPPQFGLLMADEPDLANEGIFNAIRTYSASKRRFCQDAYIHLHLDFRFTRKPDGAWLRLQARSEGVFIIAISNGSVMYQRPGIDWEMMEPYVETPLRPGTKFKNADDSIYFEAKYK